MALCRVVLMLMASGFNVLRASESVAFDVQLLKDRGIDPALAAHFRDAPRFAKGSRSVALEVNGQPKGRVRMTFDDDGQLCLEPDLLKAAGILAPSTKQPQTGPCPTMTEAFAAATVQLLPGKEQVDLLMPTDALESPGQLPTDFATGGVAGLFNYDALLVNSQLDGQRNEYRSLGSEIGLNAGNWMLRSRQSYTAMSDSSRFEHMYAYGSRTLEAFATNVQIGQLNLASPLFAGEAFNGVQFSPESAIARSQAASSGPRAQMEGVAYSPARVEVRQNGVMIYTTLVPSGPFTLRALPLLSTQLDLDVTVHEQDGQIRRFRVPAASLDQRALDSPPGFNLALGRVRRMGSDDRRAPSFATLSQDWNWAPNLRVTAGALAGTDYGSAGWGLQQQWSTGFTAGVRQVLSSERAEGLIGSQWQLTLGAALSPRLSTSLIAIRQSPGFRTLSDTGWDHELARATSRSLEQWVFSLNGSTDYGAFGATVSRFSSVDEPPQSRWGLSWSRTLPERISVSLSVERDIGNSARRQGSAAYLTLGVPLGGQKRLRGYVRSDQRSGVRTGLAMSDVVSETLAYSVNAERRANAATAFGARLNALPRYTSLDLGFSQRSGVTEFDAGLRGGVAFHRDGATLSPYPLRDTFGVLKAGDRAGLKVHTPQGPVWTDGLGRAVAASLPAYSLTRLEVDPASLARNVEALNGFHEVEAGRGSVQHLDFSVVTVRRLLLKAMTVDRKSLPEGLTVEDEQGRYLTSVLEAGSIYLPDIKAGQSLHVQLPDATRCVLKFTMAEAPDPHALLENVDATCHPLNLS
ncbi:fimbria/pilus outer membrane usher protein [Pseudomonas syringae]|nr:fimbria/pilus outer membrane usher protein [Pseudomonas syringae]MCF5067077.1 fimbria/pilus outer membrane usher protein [Pseudomonas syringae]